MDAELERIRRQIGDDGTTNKSIEWTELLALLRVNPGKKAMIIGIFLVLLDQLSGSFFLVNYTATIFASSGSVLLPNESGN